MVRQSQSFDKINKEQPRAHHNALEFPDGRIVLLTMLCDGQEAAILHLPAQPNCRRGGLKSALLYRLNLPGRCCHGEVARVGRPLSKCPHAINWRRPVRSSRRIRDKPTKRRRHSVNAILSARAIRRDGFAFGQWLEIISERPNLQSLCLFAPADRCCVAARACCSHRVARVSSKIILI